MMKVTSLNMFPRSEDVIEKKFNREADHGTKSKNGLYRAVQEFVGRGTPMVAPLRFVGPVQVIVRV